MEKSSPFSTGSGAPNFESKVRAAFVVAMIAGTVRHGRHVLDWAPSRDSADEFFKKAKTRQ
jgi:hypothetical protein